jgi:hypothetical protein
MSGSLTSVARGAVGLVLADAPAPAARASAGDVLIARMLSTAANRRGRRCSGDNPLPRAVARQSPSHGVDVDLAAALLRCSAFVLDVPHRLLKEMPRETLENNASRCGSEGLAVAGGRFSAAVPWGLARHARPSR